MDVCSRVLLSGSNSLSKTCHSENRSNRNSYHISKYHILDLLSHRLGSYPITQHQIKRQHMECKVGGKSQRGSVRYRGAVPQAIVNSNKRWFGLFWVRSSVIMTYHDVGPSRSGTVLDHFSFTSYGSFQPTIIDPLDRSEVL